MRRCKAHGSPLTHLATERQSPRLERVSPVRTRNHSALLAAARLRPPPATDWPPLVASDRWAASLRPPLHNSQAASSGVPCPLASILALDWWLAR